MMLKNSRLRSDWNMALPKPLETLADAFTWTSDELLDAVYIFASMSDGDRAEFIERRKSVVTSGKFVESVQLKTSGTTTGIIKHYQWGPCFREMSEAFDRLKFDGLGQCVVYFLNLVKDDFGPFDIEWPSSYTHRILNIGWNRARDMEWLHKLEKIHDRMIVLTAYPSIISRLLDVGVDLKSFNPSKIAFYFTGAPSDNVVAALRLHGLDARDAMRCWDGGATFVTCKHGSTHWIDLLCETRIERKSLICTDLFNAAQQFIEYRNGDMLSSTRHGTCKCGLPVDHIVFAERTLPSVAGGYPLCYRKISSLLAALMKKLGRSLLSLRIGVGHSGTIINFYITLADGEELDAENSVKVINMLKNTRCVEANVTVRLIMAPGPCNIFKEFPISKDDSTWFNSL
jgi:hypothetical protein